MRDLTQKSAFVLPQQDSRLMEGGVRNLVEQYFTDFNSKAFEQVAALFGDCGQLDPPFDAPLIGFRSIENYLRQKAQHMEAFPQCWHIQLTEPGAHQVEVTGQVKAIAFKVHVSWQFVVIDERIISQARIRLLSTSSELLTLRTMA